MKIIYRYGSIVSNTSIHYFPHLYLVEVLEVSTDICACLNENVVETNNSGVII